MQETWARSLSWEYPLEKGNGNPLQYSYLGNPMERGAWWATVHGVAKGSTTHPELAATGNKAHPGPSRAQEGMSLPALQNEGGNRADEAGSV